MTADGSDDPHLVDSDGLLIRPLSAVFEEAPYLADFFDANGLPLPAELSTSFENYLKDAHEDRLAELGLEPATLRRDFLSFQEQMRALLRSGPQLQSLTILGGYNKAGEPEALNVELSAGDMLSIVGPTGAGKSRLLEDIECLACGDTPTRRRILVNGETPSEEQRFAVDQRLVAQLSQNMSFVLDVSVEQFVALHAESRMLADVEQVVREVFATALRLTGEPFARDTSVTALSGGQSRALMIADVACLSRSPIVLIDEIENAGINRDEAMALLADHDKIVLLVTHDPELALVAPRRLVIKGGGMHALLTRSHEEERTRERLREHSARIEALRRAMRTGAPLHEE